MIQKRREYDPTVSMLEERIGKQEDRLARVERAVWGLYGAIALVGVLLNHPAIANSFVGRADAREVTQITKPVHVRSL